jgi:hypothetical protein
VFVSRRHHSYGNAVTNPVAVQDVDADDFAVAHPFADVVLDALLKPDRLVDRKRLEHLVSGMLGRGRRPAVFV